MQPNRLARMKQVNPKMVITEKMNMQERVNALQGGEILGTFLATCAPEYLSFLIEDLDFFDMRGNRLEFFINEICVGRALIALKIFWAVSTNLITRLALDIAIEEQDATMIPLKYIIKKMDEDLSNDVVMMNAVKVARNVLGDVESGKVGLYMEEIRESLEKA